MSEPTNQTEEPKDKNLGDGAGTTDAPDDTVDNKNDGGEQMITVSEAQKRADAQVAKKLKGMPSKEELAKFKEWQESQKTEAERQADEQKRYAAIEAENKNLKQEKTVIGKGVKPADAEYVLFKVNKMDGDDFDENLEKFLSENPKFIDSDDSKKGTETDGVGVKRTVSTPSSSIQDRLKARHPNIDL